jgi:hypothetical protein
MTQNQLQKTIVSLAVSAVLFVGCATPPKTYHESAPSNTARVLQNNGVQISVDPFVDSQRSKQYFGINAVSDGIAVLHIQIVNASPDKTLLIEKKNFHLILADATEAAGAQKIVRGDSGDPVLALAAITGGSLFFASIAGGMSEQSAQIQRNFINQELPDQTLAPGAKMEGFVYYKPVKKGLDWGKGGHVNLDLTDTGTQQIEHLSISL